MKRITVDYENDADKWWRYARVSPTIPKVAQPLILTPVDTIEVEDMDAMLILIWAKSIPGWDDEDAPDYAPHPLLFQEVT